MRPCIWVRIRRQPLRVSILKMDQFVHWCSTLFCLISTLQRNKHTYDCHKYVKSLLAPFLFCLVFTFGSLFFPCSFCCLHFCFSVLFFFFLSFFFCLCKFFFSVCCLFRTGWHLCKSKITQSTPFKRMKCTQKKKWKCSCCNDELFIKYKSMSMVTLCHKHISTAYIS